VAVAFLLVARVTWRQRLAARRGGRGRVLRARRLVGDSQLLTFEEPTFMASGGGQVVAFGNCDRTYHGEFFGYWHTDCAFEALARTATSR
jgi:hypothetical protein